MTGFAGWITWDQADAGILASVVDHARRFDMALDSALAEAAEHWREGGVLLTHRRAITAPEDRDDYQPRVSTASPFVLLFDGYLINRDDLIRELRLPPQAKVWPDSALTLAALEAWGQGGVARLLGDFALALWDRRERRLLLARDSLGTRPVYYHQGDGFTAFATTPRALLALPGVPKTLNEARFVQHLIDGAGLPGEGFYAAITPVPAAAHVVLTATGARVTTYWEPDFEKRLILKSDEEYVEAASALLDQAVAACLRIEGPAVATLTGGFDSTAVAATALKFLPDRRLTTITSVTAPGVPVASRYGTFNDERPYIDAFLAQYPGIEAHFVSGSGLHHWDTHWQELFLRSGVPWRNIMNVGWLTPARDRARELGARVLLMGNLGNLTLSWDGANALPVAARNGRWGYMLRELRAEARISGRGLARTFWWRIVAPHLSRTRLSKIAQMRGKPPLTALSSYSPLHPDFFRRPDVMETLAGNERQSAQSPAELRSHIMKYVRGVTELTGLGRMVHGLELRDPLADRRLLEFCFSLPDEQYLSGGWSRRLARRVLADRLPPMVLNNTERGFQCPEYLYRMGQQRSELEAVLADIEHSPLVNRLLDLPRLRQLMADWPKDGDVESQLHLTVLYRGLHYGAFLRWLDGGNR